MVSEFIPRKRLFFTFRNKLWNEPFRTISLFPKLNIIDVRLAKNISMAVFWRRYFLEYIARILSGFQIEYRLLIGQPIRAQFENLPHGKTIYQGNHQRISLLQDLYFWILNLFMVTRNINFCFNHNVSGSNLTKIKYFVKFRRSRVQIWLRTHIFRSEDPGFKFD